MNAIYLRSSEWHEHKISVDAQRAIIEDDPMSKNISEVFIDRGFTGSTTNRPSFVNLNKWVNSSLLKRTIYVYRYDRISRNVQDALNFLENCQYHNVDVVSVLEPTPSSLGDKKAAQLLFVQILFSLAEFTRNVTIENINNGLTQKKLERKILSSKIPFGYFYEDEIFRPHRENSKIVQRIFQLYTKTSMGYEKIALQLNKEGYLFYDKPFKKYHVEQILKNPIYTGIVGSKSKNLEAYISDEVIPIVSHEVYQKAVHKRESRTQRRKDTRIYPLRKKIMCPECGMKLVPRRQVSKGHNYYYYACQNEVCRQCLINADYIEDAVLETFDGFINQEEQFRSLIRATNENIKKLNQSNTKSLELLDKQKKLLFQSFEKGEVNQDEMKSKLVELNKEQEKITDVDLSEEELSHRIKTFLRLSNTSSKNIIWSYVDKVTLTKKSKLQEVFINAIKIQPRFN